MSPSPFFTGIRTIGNVKKIKLLKLYANEIILTVTQPTLNTVNSIYIGIIVTNSGRKTIPAFSNGFKTSEKDYGKYNKMMYLKIII